ncbi:DUF1376 domain-containing protein [Psychrobacter sp. Sarcosine-3u-12]|uniref:DUF1376 domain-containing protein n=1 Tax=Psychrobacter sp. Sarcosine-3u-12 TaxID=2058325 RepID=UPI000C3293CD|nr:DUF1376 domain-containing protein [Psychrobacter sp. Sarcosine-3u-12]PKG34185.1 hypothetical protein CXF65_14490 [Psychrobacter sp. Sarcosine-3u-12]
MSKSDNVDIWLPIYIGDMLAMTTRFSTEQVGALYLLIMDYWKNGEVPHDEKIIAAITGLSTNKSKAFINLLLSIQLFESNGELLFSSYLDDKKETASNNRRMKSERAKKGSDARWGKTANNDSEVDKIIEYPSNAKVIPKSCLSKAKSMLEQCPSSSSSSSSSSSNKSSLSQVNNNILNTVPIKDWAAPTLNQTNTLLKNASSSAPVLDLKAYTNHIKNFKTYYTEQELKNNPILTDDRRRDVFVTWINNDRQYQLKNKGEYYEQASKDNQTNASGNAFDHAASYVEQGQQDVDNYFDRIP